MNLTIISTGLFPDTHASAIRQSTLAKGLVELGHKVTFLVLIPQNWNGKQSLDYHGVEFLDLNGYKGNNKFLKHYHFLKALLKAERILKKKARQNNIEALVIFSFWPTHILPIYYLIKKAINIKLNVFYEITELPYVFGYSKAWLNFFENRILPMFKGIFIISNKLDVYTQKFNPFTQKLLTVVDLDFFSTSKTSPYPFPYIGYCGTNPGNKDGVPTLIEAFSKILQQHPKLKLVMVGDNRDKLAMKETIEAVKRLELEDKIIFTGMVDREMIPVILCNAQLLAVSKPNNEQNSGNFPIKIGEYLATGVPVVVTNVGEISTFIQDGISGFIAVPGSAESFAEKLEEALSNPVLSKSIGQAGRKIAQEMFNYKIQSSIMAGYIQKIINSHPEQKN